MAGLWEPFIPCNLLSLWNWQKPNTHTTNHSFVELLLLVPTPHPPPVLECCRLGSHGPTYCCVNSSFTSVSWCLQPWRFGWVPVSGSRKLSAGAIESSMSKNVPAKYSSELSNVRTNCLGNPCYVEIIRITKLSGRTYLGFALPLVEKMNHLVKEDESSGRGRWVIWMKIIQDAHIVWSEHIANF